MTTKKILFLDIETDSLSITDANIKFIGCLDEADNYTIFNMQETKKEDVIKKEEVINKEEIVNEEVSD